MANIDLTQEMGVLIVIIYIYLWLPAAPYKCTNSVSLWLHLNNVSHSIHVIVTWARGICLICMPEISGKSREHMLQVHIMYHF